MSDEFTDLIMGRLEAVIEGIRKAQSDRVYDHPEPSDVWAQVELKRAENERLRLENERLKIEGKSRAADSRAARVDLVLVRAVELLTPHVAKVFEELWAQNQHWREHASKDDTPPS